MVVCAGSICDAKTHSLIWRVETGPEPISSLCFKPGNENVAYVSAGREAKCFDVRVANKLWKAMKSYNYNKEEINQIACNSKAVNLASADDGGDIKIVDIRQGCIYKTLRGGHTSICSSLQLLPCRPLEGLPDPTNGGSAAECFNPAFVHALAVPEVDRLDELGKICVVARGDGVVDVINIESELAATRSKISPNLPKGSESTPKDLGSKILDQSGSKRLHLDYSVGGHTVSVSCGIIIVRREGELHCFWGE